MEKGWEQRYKRQILLKELGLVGQRALMEGRVLVVGVGGLGGTAALLLARAGVGRLRIVDGDVVREEDLHRQLLFTQEHARARTPKVHAAKEVLASINPTVEVEAVFGRASQDSLDPLVTGVDVVVDGTDNFATREIINLTCVRKGIPWVHGGVLGTCGVAMTVVPGRSACFRCLYPVLPDDASIPTTSTVGILPTVPTLVASIQVSQVLNLLATDEVEGGTLVSVDPWHGEYSVAVVPRDPSCPHCGPTASEHAPGA